MAKTNNIRKRALEHAKKQRWDKALEEFQRLVGVEQNNPNLYNEIGDLHLKLGQKREAFQSYHSAVDAYSRISLHNNAVAVCKKILRLNPNDQIVCGKLATLRHKQGFQRDAAAYALSFFEKILEGGDIPGDQLKELVINISRALGDAAEVLERAAEYLIKCEMHDEAGSVLEKLAQLYTNEGLTEQCEMVRKQMQSIGHVSSLIPGGGREPAKLETVESHRSHFAPGHGRYEDEPAAARSTETGAPAAPESPGNGMEGYGMVELRTAAAQPSEGVDTATAPPSATVGELVREPSPAGNGFDPSADGVEDIENAPAREGEASSGSEAVETAETEWVIPETDTMPPSSDEEVDDELQSGTAEDSSGVIERLNSEVTADIDEGDYRSHYDLGMAYLEMNLLKEAIREFQFASNSGMYQVRSLEMIGRCFLEQKKPQLAVKQLTRGLQLVGNDDKSSLGLRYNLGLAYEMIGDAEKARTFFEDVYVVDVTFRDVAEKMEKYTS